MRVDLAPADTRARHHLEEELARVAAMLGDELERLRRRGRTPSSEALRAFVVEGGEAERLAAELIEDWSRETDGAEPVGVTVPSTPGGPELPLHHAASVFELREDEYVALLLALAAELDGRFGRLISFLNDHAARNRPTLALVAAVAARIRDGAPLYPHELVEARAVRDGLLVVEGDGPIPSRTVRLSRPMVVRLTGRVAADAPGPLPVRRPDLGLLRRLVIAEPARTAVERWSRSLREAGAAAPLVLVGAAGMGRSTVGCAAAGEAGHATVVIDLEPERAVAGLRGGRREAVWHGAGLLIRLVGDAWSGDVAADEIRACVSAARGPVIVVARAEHEAALLDARWRVAPVVVHIGTPQLAERVQLWQRLLPPGSGLDDAAIEALASRFRFGPSRIAQAVGHAGAAQSMKDPGGGALRAEALARACREVGALRAGGLAERLAQPYTWEQLVVPDRIREELELAVTWIERRHQVLDVWHFGDRIEGGRGLAMLLSGPPGTGKTMAAQVLARRLQLDLYRVDLSRVLDKYVGETEKRLARLFDEAEGSGALLFFDEAETLFGKRGERKDAHDLYANIQVGYLLQRMESYEGPTILATNRPGDLDDAFTRRFQFRIEFPMPDPPSRLRIWEGMIPPEAATEPSLGLEGLADEFELSGGEIKNAALAAAYLASAQERPLANEHLRRAIVRELRKGGRVVSR